MDSRVNYCNQLQLQFVLVVGHPPGPNMRLYHDRQQVLAPTLSAQGQLQWWWVVMRGVPTC